MNKELEFNRNSSRKNNTIPSSSLFRLSSLELNNIYNLDKIDNNSKNVFKFADSENKPSTNTIKVDTVNSNISPINIESSNKNPIESTNFNNEIYSNTYTQIYDDNDHLLEDDPIDKINNISEKLMEKKRCHLDNHNEEEYDPTKKFNIKTSNAQAYINSLRINNSSFDDSQNADSWGYDSECEDEQETVSNSMLFFEEKKDSSTNILKSADMNNILQSYKKDDELCPTKSRKQYDIDNAALDEEINEDEDSDADKKINICLADFEFVTNLGNGAYGTVDLVKKKKTNQLYALKTIDIKNKVNIFYKLTYRKFQT